MLSPEALPLAKKGKRLEIIGQRYSRGSRRHQRVGTSLSLSTLIHKGMWCLLIMRKLTASKVVAHKSIKIQYSTFHWNMERRDYFWANRLVAIDLERILIEFRVL